MTTTPVIIYKFIGVSCNTKLTHSYWDWWPSVGITVVLTFHPYKYEVSYITNNKENKDLKGTIIGKECSSLL
jgi:hypothetical protein